MVVCFFCRARAPAWTVEVETRRKLVVVDACRECWEAFGRLEAEIYRLYGSPWFWLRMLAVCSLASAVSHSALLGKLFVWAGLARRLEIGQDSPEWFALKLANALRD